MKSWRYLSGAILVIILFLSSGCSWMTEAQVNLLTQESGVTTRSNAINYLRTGVVANIQSCPENEYAGYYAMDYVIQAELNSAFYKQDSLDICWIALATTPCGLNPTSNVTFLANLYSVVLRACGLEHAGLE